MQVLLGVEEKAGEGENMPRLKSQKRQEVKAKAAAKEAETCGKFGFSSVAELEDRIDAYFDGCDAEKKLYGPAGLALALDLELEDLMSLREGKEGAELMRPVKRAFLRIQDQVETDPRYREKGGMATRAIFALKQPWLGAYQDKIEAKQDLTVNVKMGSGMDESDFL